MLKNLPVNAGDIRDAGSISGLEDPLGERMATHTSILAWRIPMDRGSWQATVHGVERKVRHNWVTQHSTQHTDLCCQSPYYVQQLNTWNIACPNESRIQVSEISRPIEKVSHPLKIFLTEGINNMIDMQNVSIEWYMWLWNNHLVFIFLSISFSVMWKQTTFIPFHFKTNNFHTKTIKLILL